MSEFTARDALDTCKSPAEIAEIMGISEEDIEEALLDEGVEMCQGCGWWMESGMLTPDPDTEEDDDNLIGYCPDCRIGR